MQSLITLILWWCGLTGADPTHTCASQVFQDDVSMKQYYNQCAPNIDYDAWKQHLYLSTDGQEAKDGGGNIGDELGAS